ncbi:uncharacterized protein [Periplaneta americana]|uniref:uncharacterized protein n=1 Tax=Periplaneta americana TaxID=6978 RepID=UPI0037E8D848
MTSDDFEYLLEKVAPLIQKEDTLMRKCVSPKERLAITLRYLATGDSYQSLMYVYRIPTCTVSRIISELCDAIFAVLKNEYLKVPKTEEEWLQVADEFNKKWNFPNLLGALRLVHNKPGTRTRTRIGNGGRESEDF